MDVIGIIGAIVGLLTLAGALFTAVKTYGARDEKINDLGASIADIRLDLAKVDARLEKAEAAVIQTARLTDAVEHMGAQFAEKIQHLCDTMTLTNNYTREQLDDIKLQLRRSAL